METLTGGPALDHRAPFAEAADDPSGRRLAEASILRPTALPARKHCPLLVYVVSYAQLTHNHCVPSWTTQSLR